MRSPSAGVALRAAACVALLQGAAHATFVIRAAPRHGPTEVAVVEAMRTHRFAFAGSSRSYWDFHVGYGLLAAAIVLVEGLVFWQLAVAGAVPAARPFVRNVAALFLVFTLVHALLSAQYFFATPILLDALVAAWLSAAVFALARHR